MFMELQTQLLVPLVVILLMIKILLYLIVTKFRLDSKGKTTPKINGMMAHHISKENLH